MTAQSGQAPALDAVTLHLHIGNSTCPTCGQDIPPDKLEEISGRIAAREQERAQAIAAQLEKQHAAEKALVEARAKADLDSERQESAAREARILNEAQKAAEKLLTEKQAEAELTRGKLQEELERQRESAAKAAKALETVRAEAKEREKEIADEAKRVTELAAAQRVAAIEEARRESEAALQSRINETENSRIAAEQKGAGLASQLEELRQSSDANVAKIKEEAAAELSRTLQTAGQEAEARFRDISLQPPCRNAVAEAAKAKAEDAEARILAGSRISRARRSRQSLTTQREVLRRS